MGIYEKLIPNSLKGLLFFSFFGFFLSACEQPTEGCLDFRALQVNIGADEACSDCCAYPAVQLQFIPARIDAGVVQSLRTTDTLTHGARSGTQTELAYYLHDIFLITEQGERFEMQDTFTVFSNGQTPNYRYESSVLRVTPFSQTNYELGILLEEKTFVAVEAKVGLPDIFTDVDHTLQPVGSPLFQNTDSLLLSVIDSSYFDIGFTYSTLTGNRDSVQLADASNQLVTWTFQEPFNYQPSFNLLVSVALPVDMLLAFNNATISGELFVNDFLKEASVISVSASR